ncbi:hypothetical protein UlMin_000085 [Ulmus minor]
MEETSILTFLTVFLLILLYLNPNLGAHSFGIGDGDGPNSIRCKDTERLALLAFKRDGDKYGWLSSWGDGDAKKECCNWEGVRCSNRTGHVLALDLPADYDENHYLTGTISPSLMELHHMKYLDLSFNYFYGSIPLQLGNLSSLQYLNLSRNSFTEVGNLKWLSNLPNLKHLDLSGISLYEVKDWFHFIGRLSKLSTLALSLCGLSHINASSSLVSVHLVDNKLTSSIFPWLFNSSSSLLFLDLSWNEINGSIPDSFGKMNTLLHLNLADNYLEHEIPKSFGNLCHLQALYLSTNNLEGELAFIHNLSSCARFSTKSLKLSGNRFTGQLPDFSIFPSLKALALAHNQLNGDLTKSIQNLFDLEILDVSSNNLQGVISEPILSNFSKLRILGLSSNSLALELNFNWVPPFQLEILGLRACNLGGRKFPNWLQALKNPSYIDISSAGIYDEIPTWFWKVISTSYLSYMNFSNNQIHGVLPNLLLKFDYSSIDFSSNLFHGRLPTIQPFSFLDLSNNKFSGSILPLCDISVLSNGILDLSNNQLSGGISNYCLSNLTYLSVLNLANNNLSGKIPNSSSSMLNSLQTLDLRNNSFSGELPSCMRTWKRLTFLDLGDNNFSGKLPAWIGQNLTDLKILILRSNKFHGSIPSSLCQLQDLNILDLSHNYMSGMIPQCLNNFTAMARNANSSEIIAIGAPFELDDITVDEDSWIYIDKAMVVWKGRADEYVRTLGLLRVIDLSSNRLTGNFPDEILNLTGLVSLNLSRNSLSGRPPRDIGHLNELESLDLSRNQFSGEIPTSMSDLHFLSHLDLSYNKLSGKIPPGTQLRGFDASVYAGNEALCGPPLPHNCSSEDPPAHGTGEDEIRKWFYVGLGSGFVAGFWGFCGALAFNRAWRYAYFSALSKSFDWLLLKVALLRVRLLQRSQI